MPFACLNWIANVEGSELSLGRGSAIATKVASNFDIGMIVRKIEKLKGLGKKLVRSSEGLDLVVKERKENSS